jgi:pentalenene oxygenase
MSSPLWQLITQKDPTDLLTQLVLRKGGLAALPIPGPRRFWVVSNPAYLSKILVSNAAAFDKGGPLYAAIGNALGAEGLFTINNDRTRHKLREAMNPAFSARAMPAVGRLTTDLLREEIAHWTVSKPIDLYALFTELQVDILVQHLFGSFIPREETRRIPPLAMPVFEGMATRVFLPAWAPGAKKYRQAIKQLDVVVRELIALRANALPGDDLLSMLLHNDRLTFTDTQVRDQVFTLLMAGFDSTSTTLAWACLYLADQPETRHKLREEVLRTIGEETPRATHIAALPRLRAFLEAVLHRHPAFPLFFRNANKDSVLGTQNIAAGDQLIVAPHATHRDPQHWQLGQRLEMGPFFGGTAQQAAYLPFGRGKRKCIGERMAVTSAALSLAVLLQQFANWERPPRNKSMTATYAMTRRPIDARVNFA